MDNTLANFTDVLDDEIGNSQPISLPSLPSSIESNVTKNMDKLNTSTKVRPTKGTGKRGDLRSIQEIDPKYRDVFTYPYFNFVQSNVIDDALYSDKSIVVSAPTGSGKTVVFEMAIVQLLMELEDKHYTDDFKIIYMAPVKALCTERLTEWYPKFTKLGLMCIEATGDTDVDFTQLKPYNIIITTPEKWDMLTRRWRDHRSLVEVIKLFLIDEVHILNDEARGPVLEAVVSRMKTIESSAQSVHRIEVLQHQLHGSELTHKTAPSIRFVAVSATVSNPEDVANWLGTTNKPAVFHKFGDESRPVKIKRLVEGYPCSDASNIFKFDIFLNYKLWPIIQKYHCGKPTLIFCNTRKSVLLTAQTLSRELTINFSEEQRAKLTALASSIKTKTLQQLVLCGVGCHHAGLLFEERHMIELAFRNRDLPILITTTTLAMGVNLPAHLVIIKNTQQYFNGAYQEYSISTVLQMVGRAGRPQFDTEATAVIMTRLADKARYQALVGGCEPLQSFLHKRLPENLNSEAALGTVGDVAQCVQWLRSTFLYVRAARDPKKYLNLPQNSPQHLISKKIEELCVRAMNSLASSGLITMDEASCIESTEAGRLMSIFYLDLETMKQLMKIEGTESLDRLLTLICESHELSDMHLRVDERRCLNALNRNNAAATIRFPMKGKISTRQMKLNCIIQAVLGCLVIPDPSLNQEAMKIMRVVQRICKCLVAYVTRPELISRQPEFYSAVLNSIILAKCIEARLWENSHFVSKQLKGIGPTFSTLLATAGKVNFMLLEESHPRDLERIMNKSAPAGNVIRKQVSLLPKYHMSMIPIDEKTVTLQLVLLNQSYLSENVEQLTAGSTHKCYIVVGDSVNHLLLLASFKDNDLISVFDGTISYEIRRKHNFENKIFARCISTTFVGIDVQSEYVFNDLNQFFGTPSTNSYLINEMPVKETTIKQTCTTDPPKVRKRKSTTQIDKTQSKEKKKRDYTIIESFKYLKKTFDTASKNVKENINLSNKSPYCQANTPEKPIANKGTMNKKLTDLNNGIITVEDIDSDDFIDNEKVDSILNEIENEMFNKKNISLNHNRSKIQDVSGARNASLKCQINNESPIQLNTNRCNAFKKRRPSTTKSNYSFIELLERNLDLSDDETVACEKNNGFSDAIKNQINKYLQKTEIKAIRPDANVQLLIENVDKVSLKRNTEPNLDSDMNLNTNELPPTHKLYPCYEIQEKLDGTNLIARDVKKVEKQFENTNLRMTPSRSFNENENSHAISNLLTDRCTIPACEDDSIMLLDNEIKPHVTNNKFQSNNDQIQSIDLIENDCEQYNINKSFDVYKPYSDNSYVNNKNHKVDANSSNNILENVGTNLNDNNFNKSQAEQNVDNIIVTESNQEVIFCNTNDNEHLSLVLFQTANTQNTCNQNHEETLMQCFNKSFDENENILERDVISLSLFNNNRNSSKDTSLLPNITNHIDTTNITYFNKSNEGQPYYKDNFIKSNLAHCSNNMCEDFNPTTRSAENYFYSASKIDVTSKQTADYCVQVIKQVKVDLNITKIISSNKSQSKDMPQHDSKVKNICEIVCKEPSQPNFNNLQDFCSDKKDFVTIINQKQNTGNNLQKKTTENKNVCQLLRDNGNRYDNDSNINKKLETEERRDNVDANTKVHKILQKYSEILGKDKTKTQTPACSTTSRNITSNKSIRSKSEKPFKISDIQKFPATLSNTIVDNKHPVEQNTILTKIEDNMLIVNEHVQSNPILYRKPYCNDKSADKDDTYTCINEIDLEPINLSTDVDFEAVTAVDQSMFDPKTLLQSTLDVDREEIIPPPSEFCDYPTQYSNYDYDNNIGGLNTVGEYSQCEVSQSCCSSDIAYNNTNIFEDRCITHLTPSREIETWTLGNEDCWQDKYMSPNTSQCFTIIRRNKPNFYDTPETSVNTLPMSRQTKLGRFKFNHKTKLRKLK